MSQRATAAAALLLATAAPALLAQSAAWRQIGTTALLAGLSSPVSGPVERVWFAPDGTLFAQLPGGATFATRGAEPWKPAATLPPVPPSSQAPAPEPGAAVRAAAATLYAAGSHVWRSDDGGRSWRNLTSLGSRSILGGRIYDLAIHPGEPDRIAAATSTGVWISADGGRSWAGLNDGLPALPVRRVLAAPSGSRGVRIAIEREGRMEEYEWFPGQRLGWFPAAGEALALEERLRQRWSAETGAAVTAVAEAAGVLFLGDASGLLLASSDGGRTWRSYQAPGAGAVQRIWTDGSDRNFALAALAQGADEAPRLLRTLNGGTFWDDLTSNLPRGDVYGIAADRETGAIYAATSAGLFLTFTDLRAPAPAGAWTRLGNGLPPAAVRDVRLDDSGNTLLAAVDGYGVFATPAPHRRLSPRLVHSADLGQRPAAPGALMTVLGARVSAASASGVPAPVLAAAAEESQIQLPFDLSGTSVRVVVEADQGRLTFGLPLAAAAPAILVDRDGTPMVLDADSGAPVDLMNPARGGMVLDVLSSGLGRVNPDWPAGLPAPLEDPPAVAVPVRAWLGSMELTVRRATLAPGYAGFYVVQVELPALLDEGIHELSLEAGGVRSNRVRLYAVP
ncbi:MAG: hypothetical protein NZR01_10220 [Bryobacteraceae bacterium]|nr:hypothetical protein [Bryobacteraceae bacterium]